MTTTKPYDEILDDCLSLLRAGSTIDECVAVYPEHAAELRPQLEAARAIITARPPEVASERARVESRSRLLTAVAQERETAHASTNGRLPGLIGSTWGRWTLLPKALPAVAAMLILGGAAWGVSAATTGNPNPGGWFASSQREDRVELRGTISAIDANQLTIATPDGLVTVQLTADTEFEDAGGAKISRDAFAPGDFVKVSAFHDADGGLVAREVEFEDDDRPGDDRDDRPTATPDDRRDDDDDNRGPGNTDDDADDDNRGPGNTDDDADDDNSGPGNADDDRDDQLDDDRSGPSKNSGTGNADDDGHDDDDDQRSGSNSGSSGHKGDDDDGGSHDGGEEDDD